MAADCGFCTAGWSVTAKAVLDKNLNPTWDGDTFVVQSNGFDERTWLDHFGYPHSDEMILEERYHRLDRDNMQLVITLTDPKVYARPWVSETKNLRLSPLKDFVDELFCIPSEEQEFNRRIRNPAGGLIGKD
jgi:hypothetical protein